MKDQTLMGSPVELPGWLQAAGWGLLSASGLLIGAVCGYFSWLQHAAISRVMTFAAGVLLAAAGLVLRGTGSVVQGTVEAFAAGAILALVSETMIPEAFHGSPQFNGLLLVIGFVALLMLLVLSH